MAEAECPGGARGRGLVAPAEKSKSARRRDRLRRTAILRSKTYTEGLLRFLQGGWEVHPWPDFSGAVACGDHSVQGDENPFEVVLDANKERSRSEHAAHCS